jgi:malonate-semialdehyde dehydrogenase (acetylating) / methylmalonate-semialdehyde dehydrogenase
LYGIINHNCVSSTKDWVDDIVEQAQRLKVGGGFDPTTEIGPLISAELMTQVENIIEQAKEGVMLSLDGRGIVVDEFPAGNFVGPTVLSKVTGSTDNICYIEEIVGPVLTCLEADLLDEAMKIINSNPYGNGCALFTNTGSGAAVQKFTYGIGRGTGWNQYTYPCPSTYVFIHR